MLSLPLTTLIEAGLSGYILLGSRSLGYMLMRMGWPGIRTIEAEYKNGLSIVSGATLSAGILALSFGPSLVVPVGLSFGGTDFLFLNTAVVGASGAALFTAKRHFVGTRKVKVAVPKRVVTAGIVSRMVMERLPENIYVKATPALAMGGAVAGLQGAQAGSQPSYGFEEGMEVVSSGAKKAGKGVYQAQAPVEIPEKEDRLAELRSRLIAKREERETGTGTLKTVKGTGQKPVEKEAPGIVFEPTKEVIERVVEKQKAMLKERAIVEAGIQEPAVAAKPAAKAPPLAQKAAAPAKPTLPATPQAAAVGKGKQGLLSSIFGLQKQVPQAGAEVKAAPPAKEVQAKPIRAEAAAKQKEKRGILSSILPEMKQKPAAQAPAKPVVAAAPKAMPTSLVVVPQPAKPKEVQPKAPVTAREARAPEEEKYAIRGGASEEKIMAIRKRLEELDMKRQVGAQLPREQLAERNSLMQALRENIAEMKAVEARRERRTVSNRDLEEIMGRLEQQKEERASAVTTREKETRERKESESFILGQLRERLGIERPERPELSREEVMAGAMPKSARLLKELLREG